MSQQTRDRESGQRTRSAEAARGVVAVLGHRGLIGSGLVRALRSNGHEVIKLDVSSDLRGYTPPRPYLDPARLNELLERDPSLIRAQQDVARRLSGVMYLVNAAGRAVPDLPAPSVEVWAANAVLPGLLVRAAARVEVRRVVHISSAAASGSTRPLIDKLPAVGQRHHTPYAMSKALGEQLFSINVRATGVSGVVQRPTSLLHPSRPITRLFARGLRLGVVPSRTFQGDPVPIAVCTQESLARLTAVLLCRRDVPDVVTHPAGGLTMSDCYTALQTRPSIVAEAARLTWPAIRGLVHIKRWQPWLRRLDTVLSGEFVLSELTNSEQDVCGVTRTELRTVLLAAEEAAQATKRP